jgi:hypothetical protein
LLGCIHQTKALPLSAIDIPTKDDFFILLNLFKEVPRYLVTKDNSVTSHFVTKIGQMKEIDSL